MLTLDSRGKTRLAKWYAPYNDEEKVKLKGEVRLLICFPRSRTDVRGEPSTGATYIPSHDLASQPPQRTLSKDCTNVHQILLRLTPLIFPGPPPHRPARSEISIQLRRIQAQHKDCLPPLCWPLLLRLRRRQRQRTRLPGSYPFLCRSP